MTPLSLRLVRLICWLTLAAFALIGLALLLGRFLPDVRISFEVRRDGGTDLYALDVDRGLLVRLTRDPAVDYDAAWSPDGSRMAFVSRRSGQRQLYLMTIGGETRLLDAAHALPAGYHPVWSPDGRSLVYEVDRGSAVDLFILAVDAPLLDGENPRALTDQPRIDDRFPVWSPQGDEIAFLSRRNKRSEILVARLDTPLERAPTPLTPSGGWGTSPAWSPDGKQIAFLSLRDYFRQLYVIDSDGADMRQISQASEVNTGRGAPVWSLDGRQIAYETVIGGKWAIQIVDVASATSHPLPTDEVVSGEPLWLPDGRIVFPVTDITGLSHVLRVSNPDGSAARTLTPADWYVDAPALWR